MIPRDQTYVRLKNFIDIQTTVSKQASDNLNYNMTMFSKEQDFLRYLRMQARSPFLRNIYEKLIETIDCDQVIFLPMIDGINLTANKVTSYENPNYVVPETDRITPIILKAIKRQNVDFFRDERSFNERNSV